jgi:mono/diheme cytochrome c family protein
LSRKLTLALTALPVALATAAFALAATPSKLPNAPLASAPAPGQATPAFDSAKPLIDKYCVKCHNTGFKSGGVAFNAMDHKNLGPDAEVWEEVIRRLRGHYMPPAGQAQPTPAERQQLIAWLESQLDLAASTGPNPGTVPLHRLNRSEYANAVHDILGLRIDPAQLLPRDDKSAGFDNVADVLKVSPSFLEQYISAARQVSVQAVGNPAARVQSRIYPGPAEAVQYMHIEGLPLGTRGGMVIDHDFPVDGDYEVTINGLVGAGYLWGVMDKNTLVVTLDDAKVYENTLGGEADLEAVDVKQAVGVGAVNDRFKNIRIHAKAGPHRIGITFLEKTAAESDEILSGFVPVAGMAVPINGNSTGPRISTVEVRGPVAAKGVSDTPSRRKIFICQPKAPSQEQACAEKILTNIARKAYRRPVGAEDLHAPLTLYKQGRKAGGDFDAGIQKGLLAILASPKFLYRSHAVPGDAQPGQTYRIADRDLASRLSFFLWSSLPDDQLLGLAGKGELHKPKVLEAQVRRMLADPRANALVTNFAFQWLNVHGLEQVDPDPNIFPEFTTDLVPAFERELELFIGSVFDEDQSIIRLLDGDYTYLNERLALHYGIKNVRGGQFRRVKLAESYRRGVLGKGAVLMVTSYANRTTPVIRGAYLLEKFFGTPPSPPPPNVEAFPETQEGAVALTVRARLAEHRRNPSCGACHNVIDPIGLSLEHFDSIGRWRDKDPDAGEAIDATGQLASGRPLHGPDDLRKAMTDEPQIFAQTFTENLMTFALGRPVQYFDMPTVRAIVRASAKQDYRFSAIVLGIINSPAFQMEKVPSAADPKRQIASSAGKTGG